MSKPMQNLQAVEEIEKNLRRAFDEKVSEPVPAHLLQLLDELRRQEADNDNGRPRGQGTEDAG